MVDIDGRTAALIFLSKLSTALQADVLADEEILSEFSLDVSNPIHLSEAAVVLRDDLFGAFERAATCQATECEVKESGRPTKCKVWIDDQGSGILESETHRWRFAGGGLLASDVTARRQLGEIVLEQHTLTKLNRTEIAELLEQAPSPKRFAEITEILSSSPESFLLTLSDKLNGQPISEADFLPQNERHWDNITSTLNGSACLSHYAAGELRTEWMGRLKGASLVALRSASLHYASSELVPLSDLKDLSTDEVIKLLESMCGEDDHTTLAAGFEICTTFADSDRRFIELGSRFLDRILIDQDRTVRACRNFAAIFIISAGYLAMHSKLRARPVFWRRLAAYAHATLVVRALGTANADSPDLFEWAMRQRGREFTISVMLEMGASPRWVPLWIEPDYLVADALGRLRNALVPRSIDGKPDVWPGRSQEIEDRLNQKHLQFESLLPSITQGTRLTELPEVSDDFRAFCEESYRVVLEKPSAENFLKLTPIVEMLGGVPEVCAGAKAVLRELRKSTDLITDSAALAAIALVGRAAVLSSDVELAELAMDTYFGTCIGLKWSLTPVELTLRVLECCCAYLDAPRARDAIHTRLERMSFSVPPGEAAIEMVMLLEAIRRVDEPLAPLLGRAIAAARLASSRLKVA